MASQDDINSTLKNIVSNVGLLVNSTAVANALTVIDTSLNAIATALATVHTFGGSIIIAANVIQTSVADIRIASSNSVIVFSPANINAAYSLGVTLAPYIETITPGVGFTFAFDNGSASSTDIFYYVGYNP